MSLQKTLFEQPELFNFFQAIRLLEWIDHENYQLKESAAGSTLRRYPVGYDRPRSRELTYFRALPSLQFPMSEIARWVIRTSRDDIPLPPEMLVTFMGLTGPAGVLPIHYTRELLDRIHKKDYALQEFFDLFNHRLISFYYRAWEKYRFYVDFERSRRNQDHIDKFTEILRAQVGLLTQGLHQRVSVHDDVFLYYSGHFSQSSRNACSLGAILSDYFSVPVKILSFSSAKKHLVPDQQTRLPDQHGENARYNLLGKTAVLGEYIYNSQHRFCVCLGPLTREQFNKFLPSQPGLKALRDIVRLYVGPSFNFEIQLILKNEENLGIQLASSRTESRTPAVQLGWTTWLGVKPGKVLNDLVLSEKAISYD